MRKLRSAIAGATVVPFGAAGPAPAASLEQRQTRSFKRNDVDQPRLPLLPAGCPVTPLGKRGQTCFYLDEAGQLISLSPRDHGKTHIRNLFGVQSELCDEYWPRYSDKIDEATGERKITGWKPEEAADLLMRACAFEGIFEPLGRVRGRGAHRHADGALILHGGDRVFVGGVSAIPDPDGEPGAMLPAREAQWYHPGRIGRFVYPTGETLPRPAAKAQDGSAAEFLLGLFGSWRWERPIDAVLLLGWICAAKVGGALVWRAHGWVTGDSSTGKSTLLNAIEMVFNGAALKTANATEAGVSQILDGDTLPVMIDEGESSEDNRRINQMIELMRISSSGDKKVRGGADHKGHQFTIRSSFLFSSVLVPAMLPQDRNRLAILSLKRLEGIKPPLIDPRQLATLGAALDRRMIDHWHRFESVLEGYRQLLADHGHGGRTADQFGTLLACADLALNDFEQHDVMEAWARALAFEGLTEQAGEMSNAERCTEWLSQSVLPSQGGDEPMTVGAWCMRMLEHGDPGRFDKAKRKLGTAGMRVVTARPKDGDPGKYAIEDPMPVTHGTPRAVRDQLYLAVCAAHRGLDPLFKDTAWQGRAGTQGAWGQALRRIEGALGNQRTRVDQKVQAVTLVPLAAIAEIDL